MYTHSMDIVAMTCSHVQPLVNLASLDDPSTGRTSWLIKLSLSVLPIAGLSPSSSTCFAFAIHSLLVLVFDFCLGFRIDFLYILEHSVWRLRITSAQTAQAYWQ